ncbi:MAG: DUF1003 domain-containing protein [Alteraurantiacibacter sp.]
MSHETDPRELALELLGRELDELEPDEQRVLIRVATGTYTVPDADELAQSQNTFGDRMADKVAAVGGSWAFIGLFTVILFGWMMINSRMTEALGMRPFDGYPFIFLNLMLSTLAAVQAPIILMSQNRQASKDRITARHDYEVNLRTQLEILRLARKVDRMAAEVRLAVKHLPDD